MKKLLLTGIFAAFTMTVMANVNAVLDYAVFKHPDSGPYIEIYLKINGGSIIYDSLAADKYQASVQVGYLIKKRGSDSSINYSKFELKSPIYAPDAIAQDLIDIKRLSVPNGEYDLEIILKDLNSPDSATQVETPVNIHFEEDSIQFSQIQLGSKLSSSEIVTNFTKHGLEIQPNPTAYYAQELNKLSFYLELYNTSKVLGNEKFLLDFKILSVESGEIAQNLRAFSRKETAPLLPIIESVSIDQLPSGNYELLVEARDQENKLLAKSSKFFQRYNPIYTPTIAEDINQTFAAQYNNKENLIEHIKSLAPISSATELDYAKYRIESDELVQMQQYLYSFWEKRNKTDPAAAWDEYRRNVLYVNENFGSFIRKGYETDPGVIYLKYGKPTTVTKSRFEPGAYPYEIWQYNKIGSRTNAKFVFYNRTGQMGEDELLHSNVQGETSNYRWKAVIYGRHEPFKGTDDVEPRDTYGKEVDDFYNSPR